MLHRMDGLIKRQEQFNAFLQEGLINLDNKPMTALQHDFQAPVSVVDPEGATFIANEDYEINLILERYHWEGLASGYGYEELCSEDGWPTVAQAQADCFYCLSRFDGLEHEEALTALRSLNYFDAAVLESCAAENLEHPPLND